MMVYDSPYGVLNTKWDHQVSQEEVVSIIGQFIVSQATFNHPSICVIYHKPRDTDIIMSAMGVHHYQQLQHIFWYKTREHTTPTPVSSYTNAVEMLTIGFFPDASTRNHHWDMHNDPRKRHNLITVAPPSNLVKHADGKVLNPTQKPRKILRQLVRNHVKPGDNVLVVGAGAGGDVLGCLDSYVNVVAVEADTEQYMYLQATLEKENERFADHDSEDADEDEEEAEVPETQATHQQQPNVPPSNASSSTPGAASLGKCSTCGVRESLTGEDRRECQACDFPGPLCGECSIKDPSSDGWWCSDCLPSDQQATQEE